MRDRSALGSFTVFALLASVSVLGCLESEGESTVDESDEVGEAAQSLSAAESRGKRLFKKETFDGNGRTCDTCHSGKDGTITPEEIDELDSDDPLFRALDSDDGDGASYDRLRSDATIRVTIPLPPNLRPLDDLDATHVTLFRGVPTTNNVALDPVLMADGRAPDLEAQALGAVHDHTENEREPTAQELADIATFEETLYSSRALREYAEGGPAPELPPGRTASERRGRAHFEPQGVCGLCHSGPMLNETSDFNQVFGAGSRFEAILAGELASQPNELREWAILDENGDVAFVYPFPFPDPGRLLVTGNPGDVTLFKIPTLWGSAKTAPYFHDNSAKDLEEMMAHYTLFFQIFGIASLTPQDEADIIAYLKLL